MSTPYLGVSGPVQPALLRTHAVVVGIPLLIFLGLLSLQPPGSGGGVNIGAAVAAMPLSALGMPWSSLARAAFDSYGPDRGYAHRPLVVTVSIAADVGGAPLNVAIHAALYRWYRRRRGEPAPW